GIRDFHVTGVQTCALPISSALICVNSICAHLRESPSTLICETSFCILLRKPPSAFICENHNQRPSARTFLCVHLGEIPSANICRSEERRVGKEGREQRWRA